MNDMDERYLKSIENLIMTNSALYMECIRLYFNINKTELLDVLG